MGNTNEHYEAYYATLMNGCPDDRDYLEISDGSSTQRYCGTYAPATAPLTTIGPITVKLSLGHAAWDDSATGFRAEVCCSVNITSDKPGGE